MVTCYGIDRGKLGLEFHWMATVSMLQPPKGYRWDRDRNGMRLVSLTIADKDYHPNSDDLRDYSKRAILAVINERYAARQNAKRAAVADAKAVRKAEKEGAMICLRDSLKAGNCEAGTRAFAGRHGLDPRRHYSPTELLKIANGDSHRVRLAVAVGLRRHRQEMGRGYALLADHK